MRTRERYETCYYLVVLLVVAFFFPTQVSAQATAHIPIEQTFKMDAGSLEQIAQTGIYILEPLEPNSPMPNNQTPYQVQLAGNESKIIEGFDFSHEGTFIYKLYQQIPLDKPEITYDDQVYLITAHVVDIDGALNVDLTMKNAQKLKVAAAVFENMYTAVQTKNQEEPMTESLPDTKQEKKKTEESERRLPSTGQLKENLWLLGFIVLLAAMSFYKGKQYIETKE